MTAKLQFNEGQAKAVPIPLWTLDHPLCPQAATTGREFIAQTVLLVRVEHFTTATVRTWGKSETLHTLSVSNIFWIVPYVEQISVHHIADHVSR